MHDDFSVGENPVKLGIRMRIVRAELVSERMQARFVDRESAPLEYLVPFFFLSLPPSTMQHQCSMLSINGAM